MLDAGHITANLMLDNVVVKSKHSMCCAELTGKKQTYFSTQLL